MLFLQTRADNLPDGGVVPGRQPGLHRDDPIPGPEPVSSRGALGRKVTLDQTVRDLDQTIKDLALCLMFDPPGTTGDGGVPSRGIRSQVLGDGKRKVS